MRARQTTVTIGGGPKGGALRTLWTLVELDAASHAQPGWLDVQLLYRKRGADERERMQVALDRLSTDRGTSLRRLDAPGAAEEDAPGPPNEARSCVRRVFAASTPSVYALTFS